LITVDDGRLSVPHAGRRRHPPAKAGAFQTQQSRHRIGEGLVVLAKSVLGGLHHEYSLARAIV
jgi:hypothetical protein